MHCSVLIGTLPDIHKKYKKRKQIHPTNPINKYIYPHTYPKKYLIFQTMNRIPFRYFVFALFMVLIFSCKKKELKTERGFYYWKSSEYVLSKADMNILKVTNTQKLYVKFFEVDLDPILGAAPEAKTGLHIWDYSNDFEYSKDTLMVQTINQLNVIPTIFIKNRVFLSASIGSLDSLANNILFLTDKYFKIHIHNTGISFNEIQIDCDWTAKTKDNYFYLLKKIKEFSKKTVSTTLRLYPYKYRDKMGIPPVDKVVLMCYNLMNPLTSENENSILSPDELKKYLQKTHAYPLHLDIALPVFSMMYVYQNNQFTGVLNPQNNDITKFLKPIKPLWYEVIQDKEINNFYLRVGDKIKLEEISDNTIKETISLLKKYINRDTCTTIILFHLDSDNLKKYGHDTLNSFFTYFNK
jgi:hypothetical protein